MLDMPRKMKLLFLNKELLLSDCLSSTMELMADFELVTVDSDTDAYDRISAVGRFDVVIVNADTIDGDRFETLQGLAVANAGGVAVFTDNIASFNVEKAFDIGVSAFIPRTTKLSVFLHALRLVSEGEKYLPARFLLASAQEFSSGYGLKPRELQVLSYLCEGMPNREIGKKLGIEDTIVKMDVRFICRKLKVSNRTQAVVKAHREQLV